jgi:twinkle protein
MIKKISTSRGMMMVEVDTTKASSKGEVACHCPICTDGRLSKHQKEKKLSVNIITDEWRCNHCGAAGRILKDIPDRNYERVPYLRKPLPLDIVDDKSEYLWQWLESDRRIPRSIAIWLGIYTTVKGIKLKNVPDEYKEQWQDQFANQYVFAFPFLVDNGVVDCQYRDTWKNFSMESEAEKIFYNIDSLKGKTKVLITEGMIDVASVYTALGTETDWAIISVPNGATISPREIEIYNLTGDVEIIGEVNLEYFLNTQDKFGKIEEICFAGDIDAAGVKLRKSIFRIVAIDKTKMLSLVDWSEIKKPDGTPCKDANDVLKVNPEFIQICIDKRKFTGKTFVKTIIDCMPEIMSHYFNGMVMALKTGWQEFDYHFGMKSGDLVIGNGWQASGKTIFTVNLMLTFAWYYNWKWALWMPENYPESLVYEMLMEVLINRSMNNKSEMHFSVKEIESASKWIHEHFFCIEETEVSYTPDDIRRITKSMIRMHGINGLLIDPWNSLLEDETYYKLGGHKWLENQLTIQKSFNKQYGIATIILAHPVTLDSKGRSGNSDGSFSHPTIFQIDGGKIWAAKADVYFTAHRPNPSNQSDRTTEVYVQKLKTWKLYGIPTGEKNPVLFTMEPSSGRFLSVTGNFAFDTQNKFSDSQTQLIF